MEETETRLSSAQLRVIYADVLSGFTKVKDSKYGKAFIKHLDTVDAADMDMIRENHYREAKKKGLPTEKERLEYLDEQKEWTSQEENELEGLKSYVKQLEVNKSKLFLERERNSIINQIKEIEIDIRGKSARRMEFIGITSDSFSSKKANEHYIFQSLYKNSKCSESLLSKEEFDELTSKDIYSLVEIYNAHMQPCNATNLKRIALSGFFLNFFYLCEDNPFTFFGKPAVALTFYQAELFGHAKFFKHILQDSKNKPPHDIMDDPDAIIDWYESSKAADAAFDKVKDSGNVGGSSIVGAYKKEMTKLGAIDEGDRFIDLAAEAAKKGGSLSMEDMIKLHGH